MHRLRRLFRHRRGIMPLDRSEFARDSERTLNDLDALTAANGGDIGRRDGELGGGGMPPASWVKSYDDGRPRT